MDTSPNRLSVYQITILLLMQDSPDFSVLAKRLQVCRTGLVDRVWRLKHDLQVQGLTDVVCADMNIDIKTDVKWNCWEGRDWIYPAQNRDMWRVLVDVEMHFSVFLVPCINLCNVLQEQTECTSFHWCIFSLWYFHLPVSACNPVIFRMAFLLQEYGVIKCIGLLHKTEIHVVIRI
jgi:hypothetical protein